MTNEEKTQEYDEFTGSSFAPVIEVSLKLKIHPRWYKQFIGFLQQLEGCSKAGHSEIVGFYADGDGDFLFRWNFLSPDKVTQTEETIKRYFEDREEGFDEPKYAHGVADSYHGREPREKLKVGTLFDAG